MSSVKKILARVSQAVSPKSVETVDDAASYNPYENTPLCHEDLDRLFGEDEPKSFLPKENVLRESERLERDTMSLIRGALYAEGT